MHTAPLQWEAMFPYYVAFGAIFLRMWISPTEQVAEGYASIPVS